MHDENGAAGGKNVSACSMLGILQFFSQQDNLKISEVVGPCLRRRPGKPVAGKKKTEITVHITPTLIYTSYLWLSLYRFIINLKGYGTNELYGKAKSEACL